MNRFQRFLNSLRGRLLISHMVIALASLSIAGMVVMFGIVPIYTALTYTRMEDSLSLAYAATQAVSLPGSQDVPRFFGQRDRDDASPTPTAPRTNNRPDFSQGDGFSDPQQFLTQRFNFVFQRQLEGQNLRMLLVDLDTRLITFDSAIDWEGQAWAFQMADAAPVTVTGSTTARSPRTQLLRSRATVEGRTWLYVSVNLGQSSEDGVAYGMVLLAPNTSLADAGRYMLAVLPVPLLLVILSALGVSIWLFSAWLTRSLTRNLQPVITGTQEIAAGNLDYRVPAAASSLSEVMALGHSFNRMAAEVQSARQAQRNFVANVGHDLKTPLTSIQGFSQALADGTAISPESQERAVAIIHDESQRLGKLVDELLDVARLDQDRLQLQKQRLQVNRVLTEIVRRYLPKYQVARVTLAWEAGSDSLYISADPDRLQRVFANLLDNALAYTPAGGVVTLSLAQHLTDVEIRVADSGPGIPAEDREHIFERFYRVDKSRSVRRSTGLGLAIVRELVQAHGGTVGVESELGVGSQFWVRLPLAA